jgi:hypothetical protein
MTYFLRSHWAWNKAFCPNLFKSESMVLKPAFTSSDPISSSTRNNFKGNSTIINLVL